MDVVTDFAITQNHGAWSKNNTLSQFGVSSLIVADRTVLSNDKKLAVPGPT